MAEDILQAFLRRLSEDDTFRQFMTESPEEALEEYRHGLGLTERIALASSDHDALRRLTSDEVDLRGLSDIAGLELASALFHQTWACTTVLTGCTTTQMCTCDAGSCQDGVLTMVDRGVPQYVDPIFVALL